MNSKEPRDSLANKPGRTGISECGPLDHDLADQIGSGHDLIVTAGLRSEGSRSLGTRGGGGRIAGVGQSGTPGVKSTSARVEEVL